MTDLLPHPRSGFYEDPDEERLFRKQRLAAAFRLFALYDFDEGAAGHITARDPVETDSFWVNPVSMYFGHIRVSDLIRVDAQGNVVEGSRPVNRVVFAIHSQVHLARPDVVAAAHAHSLYGKSWSSLGRLLEPITQDSCAFYEDHTVFEDYTGPVIELEEGKRIAHALGDHKAVILRNHGLLTVGRSVGEAAWWFLAMDNCCRAQLMAEHVGPPIVIDPEQARSTAVLVGSHRAGWGNFQPVFDRIVSTAQPDLLE